MRMLKRAVLGVAGLILVLAIGGLFLPNSAHVERSLVIDAPASVLYAHYADLRRFNAWSPWAAQDAQAVYSYVGPMRGRGQVLRWDGPTVGSGSQTITLAEPYSRIEVALDFGQQGTATSNFTLEPDAGGTLVTWAFDTDFGFDLFGRYMGLLMDRWVGSDYETGLGNLAELVATLPRVDFAPLDYQFTEVSAVLVAAATGSSSTDHDAARAAVAEAWARVSHYMAVNDLTEVGPLMALTTSRDGASDRYEFEAAIPIDRVPSLRSDSDTSGVRVGQTYAGAALQVAHDGTADDLPTTYARAESLLASYGLTVTDRRFEEYRAVDGERDAYEVALIYFPLE